MTERLPHEIPGASITPHPGDGSMTAGGRGDVDLERVWHGVVGATWSTPRGYTERFAATLLRSPGLARALVTTASLLPSWIVATAAVLAVGALATRLTGTAWTALLAPALAGCGIAYAYGPGVDPAFELARTMAIPDRLVLLVRALAVFAVNAALAAIASLAAGDLVALTVGWLLPMTADAALALAVALLTRSAIIGAVAAVACWAIVALASAVGTSEAAAAVTIGAFAPAYLVAAGTAVAAVLWASSDRRLGGQR